MLLLGIVLFFTLGWKLDNGTKAESIIGEFFLFLYSFFLGQDKLNYLHKKFTCNKFCIQFLIV